MPLRDQFSDALKTSMKAGDAARTSTLRMIMAKLKDTDIAARPKGIDKVPDDEILSMLRGMVKSRRESVDLYRQGNRPELVAKEEAEIAVIERYLPAAIDADALAAIVADEVGKAAAAGQSGPKAMGAVIKAVKERVGGGADGAAIAAAVKSALG